ncbi:MAG TPA: NB-ARC domain-containing protein, partial [Albitalea sp.]|nr:NB-ARC domain-containing protein [Albitalea sp.]
MAKVYVSSTVVDLKAERQAVIDWLVQARHQPVHSYLPDSETVRDSCLADIDGCDLYVLILGHRYGFIPAGSDNPEGLSITHQEYRRAIERHKPCIVLMRTSVPDVRLSDLLNDTLRPKVEAFRAEIKSRAGEFSNLAELIANLSAGVTNEVGKPGFAAPPPRVIPKPVLRLPQHAIIGREDQIKALLDGLDAGKRDFAFEYLAGVGKTTVASELVRSDEVMKRFPDGVLWAHLGRDPVVRRQLEKWAHALKLPDDDIRACNGAVDLSALVAAAIAERRMLLVIDDVWSSEAGQYFLIGGPQCTRVLTTRYRNVARELVPASGVVSEVRKLSAADGLRLLSELAPDAARLEPEALSQVVARLDGLPIALVLVGNMLRTKGTNRRAIRTAVAELDDVYKMKNLPGVVDEPDEHGQFRNLSLGNVIDASYDALGQGGDLNGSGFSGDALRDALKSLSVLRPDPAWFDTGLAQLVMAAPVQALDELADAGMIEVVRYDTSSDQDRYTMHRMIAEYMRKKLQPDELRSLNRRAADYYFEKLRQLEEVHQAQGSVSYSAMYRYEDPEWTDCQDNWLYYLAQTGDDAQANLAFLRAWFDGFWWWSCFTGEGFDFCDQLLGEW